MLVSADERTGKAVLFSLLYSLSLGSFVVSAIFSLE